MTTPAEPARPSAAPAFRRTLFWGSIFAVVLAVVASVVGALVAELPGLLSGSLGAALTFVFFGMTAASLLIADRLTGSDLLSPVYFAVVLGTWLVKMVIFFVAVLLLRDAEFIAPVVLFITLMVGVIGSLAIDVAAVARSRVDIGDSSSLRATFQAAMAEEERGYGAAVDAAAGAAESPARGAASSPAPEVPDGPSDTASERRTD